MGSSGNEGADRACEEMRMISLEGSRTALVSASHSMTWGDWRAMRLVDSWKRVDGNCPEPQAFEGQGRETGDAAEACVVVAEGAGFGLETEQRGSFARSEKEALDIESSQSNWTAQDHYS